ncbi:DUF4232 domain-containing protein [Streptomyces griseoviridis]
MHVKKLTVAAAVVVAAGLSLTACGSGGSGGPSAASNASSASAGSSATSASSGSSGSASDGSSGGSSGGSNAHGTLSGGSRSASSTAGGAAGSAGSATSARPACDADHLDLGVSRTGTANEIAVSMKNTASRTCAMRGFPGVQLVGPDGLGDLGPDAARTEAKGPAVTLAHGEETRFLLRYLPDTSGSGKKYTRLSVTPPNERVSEIVDLGRLAITVSPESGHAPDVYVDPVGYHVGYGK